MIKKIPLKEQRIVAEQYCLVMILDANWETLVGVMAAMRRHSRPAARQGIKALRKLKKTREARRLELLHITDVLAMIPGPIFKEARETVSRKLARGLGLPRLDILN